jgi:hypothetical protein
MIFRIEPAASRHPKWVSQQKTQDSTFGPLFAGRKRENQKCGASRPGPFAGKPATACGGNR